MANVTSFVVRDARIFTGEQVYEHGYIVVKDGKVDDIGSIEDFKATDLVTISKPGHTLLPGLIDAHIHANGGNVLAIEQSLRFGVTTVMDMHNDPHHVRKLKQMAADNKDVSDFKSCSLAATIDNGWPIPVVTRHDKSAETAAEIAQWPKLKTKEDVVKYMQERVDEGADYIKLMHESGTAMGMELDHPSLELQTMIVDEAHKHGLKAVGHSTCLQGTLTLLKAGIDGLTHTFVDQPPTEELVQAYKTNNAWVNPTLVCMASLKSESKEVGERYANDKRVQKLAAPGETEKLCKCMGFAAETGRLEYAYESVRMLKSAGVDVIWGITVHQELAVFVEKCGFTPREALRSATALTAKRFGFHDRGLLEKGRKADLLLVQGTPMEDIDATLNIVGVWRDGQQCTAHADLLRA